MKIHRFLITLTAVYIVLWLASFLLLLLAYALIEALSK